MQGPTETRVGGGGVYTRVRGVRGWVRGANARARWYKRGNNNDWTKTRRFQYGPRALLVSVTMDGLHQVEKYKYLFVNLSIHQDDHRESIIIPNFFSNQFTIDFHHDEGIGCRSSIQHGTMMINMLCPSSKSDQHTMITPFFFPFLRFLT